MPRQNSLLPVADGRKAARRSPKAVRRPKGVPVERWGLAATAEAGAVRLDIDEGLDREVYTMTLNVKPVEVRFPLRDRNTAASILRFLAGGEPVAAELPLGPESPSLATLVRDREFADRFFVRVGNGDTSFVLTLAGGPLRDFSAAMADAAEQLA